MGISSEATANDVKKLEIKCKELETKLELEKTTKGRMESHISRQTDVIESLQKDLEELAVREKRGQDEQKKMSQNMRALKEEITNMQTKEMESNGKKSEIEKQLEVLESEKSSLKNQLKLAQTRIESLQKALKGEDSDEEEEMTSFMEHHRRAMSVTREGRRSMTRELSVGRELRSSSLTPIRESRASSLAPRDSRDIRSMSRDIRANVAREFEAATRDFLAKPIAEEPVSSPVGNIVAKETPFESIAEVD